MPLWNIEKNPACIGRILRSGVELCASLPRVIYDSETDQVEKMLDAVFKEGIRSLCAENSSDTAALARGITVNETSDQGVQQPQRPVLIGVGLASI